MQYPSNHHMYDNSMDTFLFYVFLRILDFRLEYDVNTGAKVKKTILKEVFKGGAR